MGLFGKSAKEKEREREEELFRTKVLDCIKKFGKQSAIQKFGIDAVNTIAPNAPDRLHVNEPSLKGHYIEQYIISNKLI